MQSDYSFQLVASVVILGVLVAFVGSVHPIHVVAVNFHHHILGHLWR